MAVRCSLPPFMAQGGSMKKPLNKVSMFHNTQLPTNKQPVPKLQISSSSIDNKVFEDQSRGIVCYKDDNGEIICEAYDEGPRFHQQDSRETYQKELQIVDMLRQSWFQIAQEDELNHAGRVLLQWRSLIGMSLEDIIDYDLT